MSGTKKKKKVLPYNQWPESRKEKRRKYMRDRNQKISQAARKEGVIGQPKHVKYKTEKERQEARRNYNRKYRKNIQRDAKAFRSLGLSAEELKELRRKIKK